MRLDIADFCLCSWMLLLYTIGNVKDDDVLKRCGAAI
jgi:hypothetical protein